MKGIGEDSILAVVFALFFFVLIVPSVSAVDIRDVGIAPVNPEFTAYIEGLQAEAAAPMCMAAGPSPAPAVGELLPFDNGLIPAPATLVWSEGSGFGGIAIPGYETPSEGYFNLRDEGRLTPVKDQGQCGSCWTFASLGSLESAYLTDTGDSRDFSENNMKNTHGFDCGPCGGGNTFMSTAYLARWSGPANESDDPYDPLSGISPGGLTPALHVQNVTFLPPRTDSLDNGLIKSAIKKGGGLYVGFAVNRSCFTPKAVNYYLPENSTCKIDGGHAVLLVGWDDNYPAENFNDTFFNQTPPGDGAFIAKNSWGTGVGDEGFLYISYYDRSTGYFRHPAEYISGFYGSSYACVLFTGEYPENYETEYSYDPLGWTSSIGAADLTSICGANVFTSEGYENLEAVSFYTREPGVGYEIAIASESSPAAVFVQNGTMPLPGYHTLPLSRPVALSPNESFIVGLTVNSPTDTRPLVIEMPLDNYASGATASRGESFVRDDTSGWIDLTLLCPNSNICIKAFTSPQPRVPEDYATIQEAVDAAMPGETVTVRPGTYAENVVVDKSIALRGVGLPLVDGGDAGDVFNISSEGVTLSGFEITGGEIGVRVTGNRSCIEDLQIHDSGEDGISVVNASSVHICDVNVNGAGDKGFSISGISGLELINSTSTGNGMQGFIIDKLDDFLIQNCTATQNFFVGMSLSDLDEGLVAGNTMAENGLNLAYSPFSGVIGSVTPYENVTFCENNTVDGKPVYIWDGHEDEVIPGDAGMVYLINCTNVTAEGLSLERNYVGMGIMDSEAITVRDVACTMNFMGLACFDSDNLRISDSEMSGNTFVGLFGFMNRDFALTSSVIANNSGGGAALLASEPSDVVLWHNSFLNCTTRYLPICDPVSLSSPECISYRYKGAYYSHSLGNYWDDYNGTDADGDGIGDSPYNIAYLSDPSPLMEPYENYIIAERPPAPRCSGGNGGNGGASHVSASLKKDIQKGETVSFTFKKTAIFEVEETAAVDTGEVLMTAERGSLPDGVEAPADNIYEYDELNLYHTTDDSVAGAILNFSVPKLWVEERGSLAPKNVVMYRYHNESWNALPTTLTGEDARKWYFSAESPGFSLFAIGVSEGDEPAVTVTPAPEAEVTTANPAIPATAKPEATGTQQSPAGFATVFIAAVGAFALTRRRG